MADKTTHKTELKSKDRVSDGFKNDLYKLIATESTEFFAIVKGTRAIYWVNEPTLKLFEYSNEEEFKKQYFYTLRKNEPSGEHRQLMYEMLSKKGIWQEEDDLLTKTGRVFRARIIMKPFSHEGKELLLVQIINMEKEKLAYEGMLREKHRFETFVNQSLEGIIIINQKGEIILANPAIEKLFGYQLSELWGNKIEVLLPERYHKKHTSSGNNYLQNLHNAGEDKISELHGRKKDGSEFPIQLILGTFLEGEEKHAFAFVFDISIKKQREEAFEILNKELDSRIKEKTQSLENVISQLHSQVRIAEEARKESANTLLFLKTIIDNAGAIIVVTDEKGIITHFNPMAEEKLGYKAEELIHKHTPALFHDPEETKKRAVQFSSELEEDIEPGLDVYTAKARRNLPNENEWIHIKKDGTQFPVRLSVTAIRDINNTITGYIGISLDISDEKKMQEWLIENLHREQELNKLKSSFVSMASHEFRTPLSGILSSANLLAKYTTTEQQNQRDRHIRQIISSANNLNSILNEFLSLGKMEEGKIKANYEPFDLKEFTDKLCREINNIAKTGQSIVYKHEGESKITLDPNFIRYILSNITNNAIKYSPENSCIHVSTKVKNGDILLSVKDNGIGISREDQKHIFERFFRASNVGNTQGTGLGLHIAKRYVEMLDGSIKMKSELGKGTEFVIHLPVKQ